MLISQPFLNTSQTVYEATGETPEASAKAEARVEEANKEVAAKEAEIQKAEEQNPATNLPSSDLEKEKEAREKAINAATARRDEALTKVMAEIDAMYDRKPGHGAWGVSHRMCWHSGIHVKSKSSENARAIADGVLVFLREPEALSKEKEDPLMYGARSDNGCVVLRHTTDIGEGGNATQITFFSIYMHLNTIDAGLFVQTVPKKKGEATAPALDKNGKKQADIGKRVFRKAPLGKGGYCYGDTNEIHFELVCDEVNLAKIVGRSTGKLDVSKNGRTDALYGDIYFYVKAGTEAYNIHPKNTKKSHTVKSNAETLESIAKKHGCTVENLLAWNEGKIKKFEKGQKKGQPYVLKGNVLDIQLTPKKSQTTENMVVSLHFEKGNGSFTTFHESSERPGDWLPFSLEADGKKATKLFPGYEYDLYKKAEELAAQYSNATPSPPVSAVYELLRFGRVIGPDKLGCKVEHWREIVHNGTSEFIDLNNPAQVTVFSDADFPHFAGWSLIDDDYEDKDCRCESKTVQRWLNECGDKPAETLAEREKRMSSPDFVRRMGKTILRIPSDWDGDSVEARWGWLKDPKETKEIGLKAPMSPQAFKRLEAHVKKLAFWKEAKEGNDKANARIRKEDEKSQKDYEATLKKNKEQQEEYERKKAEYEAYVKAKAEYDAAVKEKRKPLPTKPAVVKAPVQPKLTVPIKPEPRPISGFVNPSDCWHLPPKAFIEHMRKCLWLDKEELARIYPIHDPENKRERYRVQVNRCMQKYLVNTPTRMSHFLGQGAVESAELTSMLEISNSKHKTDKNEHRELSKQPETNGYYNHRTDEYFDAYDTNKWLKNANPRDGIKFRGRGMNQLTGMLNYTYYWTYRGWLKKGVDYVDKWWDVGDPFWNNPEKRNPKTRTPKIAQPEFIGLNDYTCIDAGGWFWANGRNATINRKIKEGDVSDAAVFSVSAAINGTQTQSNGKVEPNGLDDRKIATKKAADIVMDNI